MPSGGTLAGRGMGRLGLAEMGGALAGRGSKPMGPAQGAGSGPVTGAMGREWGGAGLTAVPGHAPRAAAGAVVGALCILYGLGATAGAAAAAAAAATDRAVGAFSTSGGKPTGCLAGQGASPASPAGAGAGAEAV